MSERSTYRYPGARPYQRTEMDRILFKGRSEEAQTLFHLIHSEPLVVLFAKSGMGKSSLLNAGLSHLLIEKDYFPVFIRCNTPDRSLIETVIDECKAEAERRQVDMEPGSQSSLWSCFKTTEFWSADNKLLTPVLVFDQFEELFEFYPKPERAEFLVQLADLLKPVSAHTNTYDDVDVSEAAPDIRVLLALREDNLAHLDELSPWLPSIFRDRFRLKELDLKAAREAIIEPAQLEHEAFSTPKFAYEDGAIDTILRFLRQQRFGERRIDTDYVEPFQLQLICQYIETNIVSKKGEGYRVQAEDLGGPEGLKRILHDFYHRQLRDTFSNPTTQRTVRRLCEKALIIEGTNKRISRAEEELLSKYKVDRALLNRMVEARLIRAETRLGGRYYELSHDTLVEPILETKRARERKITRRIVIGFATIAIAWLGWLGALSLNASNCENIAGAQKQWCTECQANGGEWDSSIEDDSRYCVGAQFDGPDVNTDFVDIPPGEFVMGTENPEEGNENESPAHTVILSDAFKMGRTEVTQAQWYAVMGNNPSYSKGMDFPIVRVSWDDIQVFLDNLNARDQSAVYRLPTEAEWEYSCRSGQDWEYALDSAEGVLEDYAWFRDLDRFSDPRAVGTKRPNAFGLYDMSGNVWEWVHDYYGPYNAFTEADPSGPETGNSRVLRSGSFGSSNHLVRCAYRDSSNPSGHNVYIGFRLIALPRSD